MIYKIFATRNSFTPNFTRIGHLELVGETNHRDIADDIAAAFFPAVIVIGDFDQTDFVILPLIR